MKAPLTEQEREAFKVLAARALTVASEVNGHSTLFVQRNGTHVKAPAAQTHEHDQPPEEPKRIRKKFYFWRLEPLSRRTPGQIKRKDWFGTVYCSGTKPTVELGKYVNPEVEKTICEAGLAHWGLSPKDVPNGALVSIEVEFLNITVSKLEIVSEETPFVPHEVIGPDKKVLAAKERIRRSEEDDDEEDQEDQDEEYDG
jgi:hypothetical protein